MKDDPARAFAALGRSAQEAIVARFALAPVAVGPWSPAQALPLMLIAKDKRALPDVERAIREAATKARRTGR